MKRLICIIFILISITPSIWADIETKKEGKVLLVEFYYPEGTNTNLFDDKGLGMEYINSDIMKALAAADKEKCNAIIFYDRKGEMFKILKGRGNGWVKNANVNLNVFQEYIDGLGETIYNEGKIISMKTTTVGGAKYRQDTYLNGKLHDTYESDWTSGWFAPTTSTFKSGGDTYVTKTYYQPPQTKIEYEREPGTTEKIEGASVFTEKVYRGR